MIKAKVIAHYWVTLKPCRQAWQLCAMTLALIIQGLLTHDQAPRLFCTKETTAQCVYQATLGQLQECGMEMSLQIEQELHHGQSVTWGNLGFGLEGLTHAML